MCNDAESYPTTCMSADKYMFSYSKVVLPTIPVNAIICGSRYVRDARNSFVLEAEHTNAYRVQVRKK